jgi:hypothetical protein
MIWISQWLCPERHCSIALAWDDKEATSEAIEEKGEGIYAMGSINRHCGICGGDLQVEHGRTKFKTMDEAMGPLKEQEAQQLLARNIIGEPSKN